MLKIILGSNYFNRDRKLMQITIQDTNYSTGGMLQNTLGTNYFTLGMQITIQDINYSTGGLLQITLDTNYSTYGKL